MEDPSSGDRIDSEANNHTQGDQPPRSVLKANNLVHGGDIVGQSHGRELEL